MRNDVRPGPQKRTVVQVDGGSTLRNEKRASWKQSQSVASDSPVGSVPLVVNRTFVPLAKSFVYVSRSPDELDAVNVLELTSVRDPVPVTSVPESR